MRDGVALSLFDAAPGREEELVSRFPAVGARLLRVAHVEDGSPPRFAALWEGGAPGPLEGAAGVETWVFVVHDAPVGAPDAAPSRDVLLVLNNAVPGREAEFDAWYRERHFSDTFRVLGFTRARRYRSVRPGPYGYLVIYDVPDGELDRCVERYARSRAERAAAIAAGREPDVPLSPAQGDGRFVHWYRTMPAS